MNNILELDHITKSYMQGSTLLPILHDASLTIDKGEVVALVGPSGCGKSTLLQIAGLLDTPTSGNINIAGQSCNLKNDRERTRARRDHIGFVYQFHHLLPEFSALENVAIPLLIKKIPKADAYLQAEQMLQRLGLNHRLNHRPSELSGGEQQRVAIARGLVSRPALLLADEPTGNLDPSTAESVFQVMMETIRDLNQAALIVTHNSELAKKMDRNVTIEEGRVAAI